MTAGASIAAELAGVPAVSVTTARYASTEADGTVRIDFGNGLVPAFSSGFWTPLPGDYVRVLRVNDLTLMLGPVIPNYTYGRVTATGSPLITVQDSAGVTHSLPRLTSYTPSVNDDVLILWAQGGVVLGKVTAVPTSEYEPPPAGGGASGSVEIRSIDSGNYYTGTGSWNTTDVWCSSSNKGAWWYPAFTPTIPAGATCTGISIYVTEFFNQFPNQLATIGTHDMASKSGAPSPSGAHPISAGTGWKSLPTSYGQALIDGTALGLATNGGGYHRFRGRPADALSGMLRIDWSTS